MSPSNPGRITRAQFLAITKLSTDTHTALKARDFIPAKNSGDREYLPIEAFLFLLADYLFDGADGLDMGRAKATTIVREAIPLVIERLHDIRDTSEEGQHADPERAIYVGRVSVGGISHPFCGTAAELGSLLVTRQPVLNMALVNASTMATVLRVRAARAKVDLYAMWGSPETALEHS